MERVSLAIKNGRLRWHEHVREKDDSEWNKRCITTEDTSRYSRQLRKTWRDGMKEELLVCSDRTQTNGDRK